MTVSELVKMLTEVDEDISNFRITVDGVDIDEESIKYHSHIKEIDIVPLHYQSPQYKAVRHLEDNINKAIKAYFSEL